ncbi:MAG: hypothetical protein FWF80_07730 [Defluviitaleaceae bacterium]|nr:hypothetical protein [Defluviitaleaceae bacterium]
MVKGIKLKKMIALMMAFLLVAGSVPVHVMGADETGSPSLGSYFADFASGDFPGTYEAYEGQKHLAFSQYVTITSGFISDGGFAPPAQLPPELPPVELPEFPVLPDSEDDPEDDADYTNISDDQPQADPADELENSVALVWYLDGERRMDKGTITISEERGNLDIPIRMGLAFDVVTLADAGLWTLRAYSYGVWMESPYSLKKRGLMEPGRRPINNFKMFCPAF